MDRFELVVVRGSGDIGSAVAHALYMQGAKVIVHDEPAPAHPRRGMAFSDAQFAGRVALDGVVARHATDLESILHIGALDELVPVCDLDLRHLVAAYEPDAIVDARMRKRSEIEDQRALADTVIGLGPGFDAGRNCHIAIETAWGEKLGAVVRAGVTSPLKGEPRPLDGVGRERFVYADQAGIWRTGLQIGSEVTAGQKVGRLNVHPVVAPLSGRLRGLSHDGAIVRKGQKIIEVDPRADAQVEGQGERPRAIAKGVLQALNLYPDAQRQFFNFERDFERTLDCMPMSVRLKMDLCGLKLSLAQWRALPSDARRTVLDAQCISHVDVRRLRRFIELSVASAGGICPAAAPIDDGVWKGTQATPQQVRDVLAQAGLPHIAQSAWARLQDLQRFALWKLTAKGQQRNLRLALEEFGLAEISA